MDPFLLDVGGLFAANTTQPASQPEVPVPPLQVPVSLAANIRTSGGTVPIPEVPLSSEQPAPGSSRMAGPPEGEPEVLPDSFEDEYYDYNRFTHDFYEYEQGLLFFILCLTNR